MSNLVFVTSIPRKTVTGLSEFTDPKSGLKLNKTKMGKCTHSIMAAYDSRVGGLANYISYTAWTDTDTGKPVTDANGKALTLQDKMEQKYNKPQGYYTNLPPRLNQKPEDVTYFQSTKWVMQDGTTVFDLDTEHGELGYYIMLSSNLVANSEREWREHKWPKAEYYISLMNESDEIKYEKSVLKAKAFANLFAPSMSPDMKRMFVSLLNLASTKAVLTQVNVDNLLMDYIEKSSFLPGSNIDKFNALLTLTNTSKGKEEISARYMLAQCVDLGIIRVKQDTYTLLDPKGNTVIGERTSEAIDYLMNPKKASEVEYIQAEIKKRLFS